MLNLHPSKLTYFLCGTTQIQSKLTYCGDWVSKQDGKCVKNSYESCSVAHGPVKIFENECPNNAFLKKMVHGSDENPYCAPLLRGGCCVASMFHALTDDDESSLWPLCVRTWATQTCGVDLSSTCTNTEISQIRNVQITITIKRQALRRLGDVKCTDHEARQFSGKVGKALSKTSVDASNAGARPIVISDSACMDTTGDRKLVTDLVVRGENVDARLNSVVAAANSGDFGTHLQEEGIGVDTIQVRGLNNGNNHVTSVSKTPQDSTTNPNADAACGHVPKMAIAFIVLIPLLLGS